MRNNRTRFVMFSTVLLVAGMASGCGERALTPAERVQDYTVIHQMKKAEAYTISETWMAQTHTDAKVVIDMRQPEAGVIIGQGQIEGSGAPAGGAQCAFTVKISSKDNASSVVFTLKDSATAITDDDVRRFSTQERALAASVAKALGGTVAEPAAAPVPASKSAAPMSSMGY